MSRWLFGLGALAAAAACGVQIARRRAQTRALLDRKRQEDLLDEALMESFPASDPVSVSHVR